MRRNYSGSCFRSVTGSLLEEYKNPLFPVLALCVLTWHFSSIFHWGCYKAMTELTLEQRAQELLLKYTVTSAQARILHGCLEKIPLGSSCSTWCCSQHLHSWADVIRGHTTGLSSYKWVQMLYSKISLRLFKKKINYQNLLPWLSPGLADDSLKLELPFLVGSHLFFVCTYIQQFASAKGGTSRSPIPVILLGSVSCHFLRSLSKEWEGTKGRPSRRILSKEKSASAAPKTLQKSQES